MGERRGECPECLGLGWEAGGEECLECMGTGVQGTDESRALLLRDPHYGVALHCEMRRLAEREANARLAFFEEGQRLRAEKGLLRKLLPFLGR